MKELMLHVERIVRPVRASQRRKLGMRRELLSHLEAALAEERERSAGDEAAAMERARRRLGETAELTAGLQRTVPLVQRMLLARIPATGGMERWGKRASDRLHGRTGPMTMGHEAMLTGIALLAGAPILAPIRSVTVVGVAAQHLELALVGGLIAWPVMFLLSWRLVFAAASPGRLGWGGILRRIGILLGLQLGLTFFSAYAIADRWPTAGEVAVCMGMSIVLQALAIALARRVGGLGRAYEPWLKLDIAE